MLRSILAGSGFRSLGSILMVLLAAPPSPSDGQILTGVEVQADPSTPDLGQPFRLKITLRTAEGWSVGFPDSLEALYGFRQQGRVSLSGPAGDAGEDTWAAAYSLIPLRPGYRPLPSLELSLASDRDGGEGAIPTTVAIPLGGVAVSSVLPPPEESVDPAPLLAPFVREPIPPPSLPLTLAGCLLSGAGWFILRRQRKTDEIRWGGSGGETEPGDAPSLHDQLLERIEADLATPPERITGFDEAVLLIRQILESRTPRNLVSHSTPELLDFLRNGSGLRNPEPLERALSLAETVRFRKDPPSSDEWLRFREAVSTWLLDESPDVGRKRRTDTHA